jgi:deoxycytidylate deaminase
VRYFQTGDIKYAHCCHAEMLLAEKIDTSRDSEINVARFKRDGSVTMAKPCRFCQRFLQVRGIKRVNYTTWNGGWEKLIL